MPVATFYTSSPGLMADGTHYHAGGAFVASRVFALGTRLRLSAGGRSLVVTVRDRTAPGRTNLDLPSRSFASLAGRGWRRRGVLHVSCRVLSRPKKASKKARRHHGN